MYVCFVNLSFYTQYANQILFVVHSGGGYPAEMSDDSLKDHSETTVERADSVSSDVYLLNDPLLKEDYEQTHSDSLDAGSEDLDSAETQVKKQAGCRRLGCGLAVAFATVVGVFVVAAVVVVVILSVTSLQHPDKTKGPSRPVVRLKLSGNCDSNIVGVVEDSMHVFKVNFLKM